MTASVVNDMERQAMDLLVRGDHPILAVLRVQFSVAAVAGRDFTGVGFFTRFDVPGDAPRLTTLHRIVIDDVYAEVTGLQYGAGFVLFVERGVLHTLECFIFEDAWPPSASLLRVYYVRPKQGEQGRLIEMIETAEREMAWAIREGAA